MSLEAEPAIDPPGPAGTAEGVLPAQPGAVEVEPPAAPIPRSQVALRQGAGIAAGFALLSLTNSLAVAIAVPAPRSWMLRVARHALQIAETTGIGVVVALVTAGAILLAPARLGRRAVAIGIAVYVAATALAMHASMSEYIARQASVLLDGRFEGALYYVYLFLFALTVPAAHLLGVYFSRFHRLRIVPSVAALGGVVVNQIFLRDDYFAVHCTIGWVAALLVGITFSPVFERAARALLATRNGRAALGAGAVVAMFGIAFPPSNLLRHELFRDPCSFAPWVLARALWSRPEPRSHTPPPSEPWTRDRSGEPPIPPTTPPLVANRNLVVVLVTIDATRGDVVNDPQYEALFPTLTELKHTGTTFLRATSPASQTSVSITSTFTGKAYSELAWLMYGTGTMRFAYPYTDRTPRFPETLVEHGVATASVLGVNFLQQEYGVTRGIQDQRFAAAGRQHAFGRRVVEPMLKRLEHHGSGPLFLFAHMMEPHAPYDRGRKDGTAFERYVSEIGVADRELARVLRVLKRRFEGRFVFVVSADHGEAFGEHETHEHSKTLYDELLHVPLLVRTPVLGERVVEQRVALVDVGATILDLYGLPTPAYFLGRSLVPLLEGREQLGDRPLLAEGRLRRAYTRPDGLKVIDDIRRKTVEAYDLEKDPGELDNLFGVDPRADEALASLRAYFELHQHQPAEDSPYKP